MAVITKKVLCFKGNIMSKFKSSSKKLLLGVLKPHTDLAIDLIKMVNSLDTSDPSYRFQIASIIIFLAGVDKTLNLAFELLYLVDKVDWKWMVSNQKYQSPAGFIECNKGLTAKINKLIDFGIDITCLQGIIDLRNEYVHSCNIYLGYTLRLEETESKTQLKPFGPVISAPLPPITYFRPENLQAYANNLVDSVGIYIDNLGWQNIWVELSKKLECLPKNPEPEYAQIINDSEKEFEIINMLNKRYIGNGAKLLR